MRSIGIDFGTTTTLVGEGVSGRPSDLIPLGRLTRAMPSTVGRAEHGSLVAGEDAENLPLDRVVRSVKRAITEASDHLLIEGTSSVVDADEAIVAVLRELAMRARRLVRFDQESIRLGCPAMWTGPQRDRLLQLARRAGLPVAEHTLVDEPIAAGVAWVSRRTMLHGEWIRGRVLVFDMGGGTLDIAHLDVEAQPGMRAEISVLSAAGLHEAGDLLDDALLAYVMSQLAVEKIPDTAEDPLYSARMRRRVGEMKVRLSTQDETRVDVGAEEPLVVSRAALEAAFSPQLDRAEELVRATVRASQMTHQIGADPALARAKPNAELAREVDYVVLVGGMSRIPAVAGRLRSMFPLARLFDGDRETQSIPPDEIVAAGLASTSEYEDLNLHRPGFDFRLTWTSPHDGQSHSTVLYPAYSPLYNPSQAVTRSMVYYERELPPTATPSTGEGRLVLVSPGGKDVHLTIDNQRRAGLRVPFGRAVVRLRIYPNGKIVLVDGRGSSQHMQVSKWPVVRGADHWELQAKRIENAPQPLPDGPDYPHGPQHG